MTDSNRLTGDATTRPTPTARPTTCPKCAGSGRTRYSRPGGWLSERCVPCHGRGTVDGGTAGTLALLIAEGEAAQAAQAGAREAALGALDGPCCDPAEVAPCHACLPVDVVPDDEPAVPEALDGAFDVGRDDLPYEPEPTEEDWADYRAYCREHDDRVAAEQVAAAVRDDADAWLATAVYQAVRVGDFPKMLAALSDAFRDHAADADVRWVGQKLANLHDQATLLLQGATSGEQFDERLECHLDAQAAMYAARRR